MELSEERGDNGESGRRGDQLLMSVDWMPFRLIKYGELYWEGLFEGWEQLRLWMTSSRAAPPHVVRSRFDFDFLLHTSLAEMGSVQFVRGEVVGYNGNNGWLYPSLGRLR